LLFTGFASTNPFSGSLGSGMLIMVVKFRVLSGERWILICFTTGYGFFQLNITLLPLLIIEKSGKVSCADISQAHKKTAMLSKNFFMTVSKIRVIVHENP